jgi:excinuclease UvrABC nuclease subunit
MRRRLLEHFDPVDSIKKASLNDLKVVEGIGRNTVRLIFNLFAEGQMGE